MTDWNRRAWQPMARNMGTLHRVSIEEGYRPIEVRPGEAGEWRVRYLPPELRAGQEREE